MAFKDLREFIQALQARGDLKLINGASPELEIGGVSQIAAESPQSPALLFDSIGGFAVGQRVLTNVIASKARERLVFGISEELSDKDALHLLKEKLAHYQPIAPVKTSDAPIRQNSLTGDQLDLGKLPWLRWYEGEREPCHYDAVIATRRPDSAKLQILSANLSPVGRDTLTLRGAAIGAANWSDGKACPVAIVLGHEPALLAAALLTATAPNADYGLAGYLRGAPVEIIDGESSGLPIPAAAEIVLEGVIEPRANADQERPETAGATVKVQRACFRDDPIVIGNAPFFDAYHGVLASGAASLWRELERMGIANIVAVNRRAWGVTILAIKQAADGDVQRTAKALMESSAGRDMRYAVIVDDDIDPYNLEKVFWAIVTRYEAQQAVQILRRLQGDAGTAAAPGSVVIIDGCRPFRWLDKFPRTTDISEELMRKTVEKWGKVLERR